MSDNVYCNGQSLAQWLTPIGLVKMWGVPPAVGNDYQIPGYVGALPAQLGRGPRNVQVGGLIVGSNESPMPYSIPHPADINDAREIYHTKLSAFTDAVYQNGDPFTLTWVTGPAGSTVTRSAVARYSGGIDDINQLTPWIGRVAVDFLLLTPYWQ